MAVLVDTGILYALADADDRWHEPARRWLATTSDLLIVPVTVLPEVAYLLHTRLGPAAELAFVQSIAAGELDVEELRRPDLARCETHDAVVCSLCLSTDKVADHVLPAQV